MEFFLDSFGSPVLRAAGCRLTFLSSSLSSSPSSLERISVTYDIGGGGRDGLLLLSIIQQKQFKAIQLPNLRSETSAQSASLCIL